MRLLLLGESSIHMPMITITDFGAVADGETMNTDAIAAAIAAASTAGGGTVVVPAGVFVTGAVWLASNVTLHLEPGATLQFSRDLDDFPTVQSRWAGIERHGYSPCVFADGCENVAITGRGTIDGSGDAWWGRKPDEPGIGARVAEFDRLDKDFNDPVTSDYGPGRYARPPLVQFKDCRNVRIEGVTLTRSPFWTLHPLYCDNVTIDGVTVINPPGSPNTDGMDIDSCRNVHISNCQIDVGDDCIVIKSGMGVDGRRVGRPSENITITNCTMLHGHGGVVIGSDTSGFVRRVTVSNCVFEGTDRGIRLKTRRGRGGGVEDLRVSNVIMAEVLCPFVMNLYYCCDWQGTQEFVWDKNPRLVSEETPILRRLHFTDITVREAHYAAGFLYGLPELPIEDVTFDNVSIEMARDARSGAAAMADPVDEMCKAGFFCRNIRGGRLSGVTIRGQDGAALDADDSAELQVDRCDGM